MGKESMKKIENDIIRSKLIKLQEELESKDVFSSRGIKEGAKLSFCFVVFTLQRFLDNYVVDEILEHITEGSDDNNFDIFHVDESEESISLNLFQSKFRKETNLDKTIGANEIKLFLNSVERIIIDGDIDNIVMNQALQDQYKYFKDVCSSKTPEKINLYLATNGADLNEQEMRELKSFKDKHSIIGKCEVLNTSGFYTDFTENKGEVATITVSDNIFKINNKINACIVSFKTYALAQLFEKFQDRILEKNVRKLLKSSINKNLASSLLLDPEMFWYKNNGLSIVCSKWTDKKVDGHTEITLENPYIVNGGQTTKTIYNLFKEYQASEKDLAPFYDSLVMARIYQTTDEDEIGEIVQGTNRQNKITSYDLKSSNRSLGAIKAFFSESDIALLVKRDAEEAEKNKNQRSINSDTLLQVYCATYKGIPHKSKGNKTKLIDDFYDDVYNTNQHSIHNDLLNSFRLCEFVRNANREKDNEHLKHSFYSVLYLMVKLKPDLMQSFDEKLAEKAYTEAVDLLDEIVQSEKPYHNFFKSERSTIAIEEKLKQITSELSRK
jgi:hypothetical protein